MKPIPKGYYVDVKGWSEEDIDTLARVTADFHDCDIGCTLVEDMGDKYEDDYRYMLVDTTTDVIDVWVANKQMVEEDGYKELSDEG